MKGRIEITETATLHIPAIHCEGCIESIQRIVERKGAKLDEGDHETKNVTISFDPSSVSSDELVIALANAEFDTSEA